MTLAQKIEQVLKGELKPESIITVIEMAEFLKFKENQRIWNEINESESEYITPEEQAHLEEVKAKGEFIDQDDLLKELGINKDDTQESIRPIKRSYFLIVMYSVNNGEPYHK